MIAKIEGIQRHGEDEILITLQVRDAKVRLTLLWYIPTEEAKNYFLGQEFKVTIERKMESLFQTEKSLQEIAKNEGGK